MSFELHTKEANFSTVTKNIRRTIPLRCIECPLPNSVAEELPRRATALGIQLQYLIEPSAEVFGDCKDGLIELDYGECPTKCSNPNVDVSSSMSIVEQLTIDILNQADHTQNHGRGRM